MQSILVIDNDPCTGKALQSICLEFDLHVIQAFNGQDGLEMMRQFVPMAVLLNVNLPGYVSGWSLREVIRNDKRLRKTALILLTESDYDRRKIRGPQQRYHFVKPLALPRVRSCLSQLVEVRGVKSYA
jgi:DNA-binding response OmpR family regulator